MEEKKKSATRKTEKPKKPQDKKSRSHERKKWKKKKVRRVKYSRKMMIILNFPFMKLYNHNLNTEVNVIRKKNASFDMIHCTVHTHLSNMNLSILECERLCWDSLKILLKLLEYLKSVSRSYGND